MLVLSLVLATTAFKTGMLAPVLTAPVFLGETPGTNFLGWINTSAIVRKYAKLNKIVQTSTLTTTQPWHPDPYKSYLKILSLYDKMFMKFITVNMTYFPWVLLWVIQWCFNLLKVSTV